MSFRAIAALAAALLPAGAEPQDRPTINADLIWGRGYFPEGDNTVLVTIDNPGKAVDGKLVLRWALNDAFQPRGVTPSELENAQGSVYEIPVSLPEKSRRQHFAYVRGIQGGRNMGLWVFLMSGRKCLARFCAGGVEFKEETPVVGQVGLGGALGTARRLGHPAPCRPEELPDRWFGYAGLHALVWLDADAAAVREPTQIEALKQWIATGGHLVIARADTAGLAGTFLEGLAPVTLRGARAESDWSALAEWCDATPAPSGEAAVLDARPRGGRVLIGTAERPLAVTAPRGRGRVTFLPFDPGREPFVGWAPGERFWGKLLALPPPPQKPKEDERWNRNRFAEALGSGTLANLLASHPDMPLPSLGWAFFMILAYLLLVGPVDYLVLRWLRRMELTWITFPACALVFSAVAIAAGSSIARLPPLQRDVAVVDHLPEADLTCGWSASSLLTPQEERVAVAVRKPRAAVSVHNVFGHEGFAPARFGPDRVDDWFFPRGSTGAAVARWCENGAAVRVEPLQDGRIRVTNGTDRPLRDALYVRGGRLVHIEFVAPGVTTHDLKGWEDNLKNGLSRLKFLERTEEDFEENEYLYGPRRGIGDREVWRRLRAELVTCTFARALGRTPKGVKRADALDASDWISGGGAVLLGWTQAPEALRIEGVRPQRTADTLVRVFVRYE